MNSREQDFETVRKGLDGAWQPALSRIEAVQKLATEQVEWLQRTKKEAVAQRDALRAALEELRDGDRYDAATQQRARQALANLDRGE